MAQDEKKPNRKDASDFPIIAIGASAGGLEAFELFFRNLPSVHAAFVLIQHLGGEHPSILPDLIRRFTKLPVHSIEEGMRAEANHVYVIPANVYLALQDGVFKLTDRSGVRPHVPMPIDFFFRSLVREKAERAIVIILSGTGTDGTLGLGDINGAGGVSMVQDPADARFPGMPESAINSGHVDFVLPASQMGSRLKEVLDRFYPVAARTAPEPPAKLTEALGSILSLVRIHTHHDFSAYKKATLLRRIERRMVLHSISDPARYIAYLEKHHEEAEALFNEFLIRVTSFFRDHEAFGVLKRDILPGLLDAKPHDEPVRVWVPGCSTGEEAYSIAIILNEYLSEHKRGNDLQIFATDIDAQAVEKARAATYPENIAGDVSEERIRRFFTREDGFYRVKKDVREKIVFAIQDLAKDPPFTRLDLLSCRNVLIYMDTELQKRLIPLFHYSLKPKGILFLGSSEGIGDFSDLFDVRDRKWKIFEAKETGATRVPLPSALPWTRQHAEQKEEKKRSEVAIADVIRRRLLRSFTPPAVVVDEKGDIVFVQGETGRYLQPAEGSPQMNLFTMARQGMVAEVRLAVKSAKAEKKEVLYQDLPVKTEGGVQPTNLKAVPLTEPGTDGLVLVVFEQAKIIQKKTKKTESIADSSLVERLQDELRVTKEHLQQTVEELRSSNEELTSANEELQSTNEEVQSTNEELETSREELQSVNEELVTVNAELQSKIEQLTKIEVDLKNLMEGMQIATVFVDMRLRVVRFTQEATKLINFIPSDVGRPIGDIATKFKYDQMLDDVKSVLSTLQNREVDIQVKNGEWYHMRIIPHKNQEDVIIGVVITFTDITALRQLTATETARDQALAIVDTVREPLIVLDGDLRVVSANRSFYHAFFVKQEETEGRFIYDLGNRQWDIPDLRRLLEEILPRQEAFRDFKVDHVFPSIGRKVMLLNAREIKRDEGVNLILLAIEDITSDAAKGDA